MKKASLRDRGGKPCSNIVPLATPSCVPAIVGCLVRVESEL